MPFGSLSASRSTMTVAAGTALGGGVLFSDMYRIYPRGGLRSRARGEHSAVPKTQPRAHRSELWALVTDTPFGSEAA